MNEWFPQALLEVALEMVVSSLRLVSCACSVTSDALPHPQCQAQYFLEMF